MRNHTIHRRAGNWILITLIFGFIGPTGTRAADEEEGRPNCPVWNNLVKAQKNAEDTARRVHGIKIPPELEKKIDGLLVRTAIDNPGILKNFKAAINSVMDQLTFGEKAQLVPWIAAREARDLADAQYQSALAEYSHLASDRDAALKKAQQKFKEEQDWLESEKEAIKSMPRDDSYLDRVSRITARLKVAYLQMKSDLAPFKDCFSDVATFLEDKDERLKRIDALEAEIARRRGLTPGGAAAKVAAGGMIKPPSDPDAPGPLGDTFVCDGPEVSPKQGTMTSFDASGVTFQVDNPKGGKSSATVQITKPPPLKIRVNERVEMIAITSGEPPAWSYGSFDVNNVIARQIPSDNGCSTIGKGFKGTGDPSTATLRFYFGPGLNPAIVFYCGQYNSHNGTEGKIVWKYHKEGGH